MHQNHLNMLIIFELCIYFRTGLPLPELEFAGKSENISSKDEGSKKKTKEEEIEEEVPIEEPLDPGNLFHLLFVFNHIYKLELIRIGHSNLKY